MCASSGKCCKNVPPRSAGSPHGFHLMHELADLMRPHRAVPPERNGSLTQLPSTACNRLSPPAALPTLMIQHVGRPVTFHSNLRIAERRAVNSDARALASARGRCLASRDQQSRGFPIKASGPNQRR